MRSDRWQRIEELFESALALPAEARDAFLVEAAGNDESLYRELQALLRADECCGNFLEQSTVAGGPGTVEESPAGRIGPYRLLRRLGQGGMSQVYLGVRDDDEYQKLVALKVIRHGTDQQDLLRRFRTERQILAVLDHPYIARLLDGGHTEDGLPYFVMDYVEGIPLDQYSDSKRLTIRQRLELFRSICTAVQYAHQNLVVHRDLKPSNILVMADGTPKLLDFGIAKLLKPEQFPVPVEVTATRFRPMTPWYASPEQVRGQPITTASDVYSLGVLLYELLTGQLPYRVQRAGARELEQAVLEQPPEPPSTAIGRPGGGIAGADSEQDTGDDGTQKAHQESISIGHSRRATLQQLRRQLRGDLENIVLTALRKEPARRYVSVEQMAEDVRRLLSDLPVLAHKDSLGYRVRKFLVRNRIAAAASAAFLVLLIAFSTVMTVQRSLIAEERDRAEQERDQSKEVVAFLQDIFQLSDPFTAGEETIIAREFLDRGARRVARELRDRPEIRATLMEAIGNVYRNLELYDSADPLLRQALAIRRQAFGNEDPQTAQSLSSLGKLLHDRGDYSAAEPLFQEALAVLRQLDGDEGLRVAATLHDLGRLKFQTGAYREAGELYAEALAIRRAGAGDRLEIGQLLTDQAILTERMGEHANAETLFLEALDLRRRELGNEHPLVIESLNNLGVILGIQGRLDDAEPLFREALELRRKLFGDASQHVAESLHNLAALLTEKSDYEGAETLYREAIATLREILGEEHPLVAEAAMNLAFMLQAKGDSEGAEEWFQQSLAARRRQLGDRHTNVGISLAGLARLHVSNGEPGSAEPLLREAFEIFESTLPEDHWRTAEVKSLIGGCLLARAQFADAEPLLLDGYRGMVNKRGGRYRRTREALDRVIGLYEAWGKDGPEAEYRALASATDE